MPWKHHAADRCDRDDRKQDEKAQSFRMLTRGCPATEVPELGRP